MDTTYIGLLVIVIIIIIASYVCSKSDQEENYTSQHIRFNNDVRVKEIKADGTLDDESYTTPLDMEGISIRQSISVKSDKGLKEGMLKSGTTQNNRYDREMDFNHSYATSSKPAPRFDSLSENRSMTSNLTSPGPEGYGSYTKDRSKQDIVSELSNPSFSDHDQSGQHTYSGPAIFKTANQLLKSARR